MKIKYTDGGVRYYRYLYSYGWQDKHIHLRDNKIVERVDLLYMEYWNPAALQFDRLVAVY
ncbi:MAG: hypothetical protein ACW99E_22610 [Promethearchaeota archaeon]